MDRHAPDVSVSLDADQGVFLHRLLAMRHVTMALLCVAAALLPQFEKGRWITVGVLAANGLLLGWYAQFTARVHGVLPLSMPWVECATNIALVAMQPQLFRYAVVIALGQLALGIVMYGTWPACFSASTLVLGYPLVLRATHSFATVDAAILACFGAFIPSIGVISGQLRMLEQKARSRYRDLLSGLDAVVWEGDPKTLALTWVSPQVVDMFGLEPSDLIDRWMKHVHPEDRERDRLTRQHGVANDNHFVVDLRVIGSEGKVVFIRDTIRVERDADGTAVRLRGVMVDMTRQQEAEATIRKQAQYDTLTGLPNRMLFNEHLRNRLDLVKVSGEGIVVLLLDLNGFKEVNDTLGHAVGDQLLQAIAGRLAAYLPERAMVARLGGDEFAVLLDGGNARDAAQLAETIASCLQPPITVDNMTIQAGASTGIALFPGDGDNPAALLRRADAAMYEAKQSGRSYMFATPDDDEANVRRLQLLGELRASIATGDFRVYHQPKIDLKTGRVVGTEGLVRWHHKQFGLLTPAEFVELSELSGLIMPLTRWVVEQGIRDAAEWRRQGFELAVALNLSVRNFFDQGLPSYIAQLLAKYDLPGELLVLEITEREVMADRALARQALSAFRSLGVKISVDDFGTGYSSLSQLQQLPIDEIKVDASFVAGMLHDKQDAVIVRSIVDLGHNLGLEVVAEGAETQDQLRALRALGCDRAQGYVISRPMPAEDFTAWLAALTGPTGPSAPVPQFANDNALILANAAQQALLSSHAARTAPAPGALRRPLPPQGGPASPGAGAAGPAAGVRPRSVPSTATSRANGAGSMHTDTMHTDTMRAPAGVAAGVAAVSGYRPSPPGYGADRVPVAVPPIGEPSDVVPEPPRRRDAPTAGVGANNELPTRLPLRKPDAQG